MEKELKIKCPCCDSILFIDRITGRIIETRKPLVEQSSGDRLADAFTKTRQDKEKRSAVFDDMAENLEKKKKLSEELFKSSLEDAKKDKNEKPHSIFDAD
ncbi:hypothetical protein MNBD_NITROSPINAE04-1176 [hydrothermal vent metagenome]|uniref:2-nitropropane dioxygenase n=1 Tax=hydrothermal vent metagenome TaxID=652676 RepID=A0A3B1B942_9ZZZZ